MNVDHKLKILGATTLWVIVFVAAFILPRLIEPTGSGFTRGFNRLPFFFGLQCLGLILALTSGILAYINRATLEKWVVITGVTPFAITALLVSGLLMFYLGAMLRIW